MKKGNLQKNVDKYRAKVSEKEMDIKLAAKAEQEAQTLEAELPALQAAVSKAQEAKAKAESRVNSRKQETGGRAEKALETRKGEIENRKAKIEEEAAALRTELSAAQAEKASLATEIVQAEAGLKKASTDLETASEAYRKSLLDNGFTDVEEAKILRTRSTTEVDASKKEVDDYFASLTGARSLDEDQRSKGYDKLPERNLASEEETCKDLEHDASNKTDEAASYDAKLKQDKTVLNQIKTLIDGSSEDIRKAAEASALSEVARGTMAGTLRVDFETFYHWSLAHGYKRGLSIDRICNSRGYSPGNCRWVTKRAQGFNKSTTTRLEANGKILTLKEWSMRTGIREDTLIRRLEAGWTPEDAVSKPVRKYRK